LLDLPRRQQGRLDLFPTVGRTPPSAPLPLPLLVLGVGRANHHHPAMAADDSALFADSTDGGPHLHGLSWRNQRISIL